VEINIDHVYRLQVVGRTGIDHCRARVQDLGRFLGAGRANGRSIILRTEDDCVETFICLGNFLEI